MSKVWGLIFLIVWIAALTMILRSGNKADKLIRTGEYAGIRGYQVIATGGRRF